jgi:hypothetical protein
MKKKLSRVFLFLTFVAICIISCSKSNNNKQSVPPPPPVCDTANMKYATDIVPILQNNCYGCHGIGNTSGSAGILLEGYSNIKPYADLGTLKGVITHATGYVGMPYLKPKLDSCTLNKILDWIGQGNPNN